MPEQPNSAQKERHHHHKGATDTEDRVLAFGKALGRVEEWVAPNDSAETSRAAKNIAASHANAPPRARANALIRVMADSRIMD